MTVLRGLYDAGIDFGVFGSAANFALDETDSRKDTAKLTNGPRSMSGRKDHVATIWDVQDEDAEGGDEGQQSRAIIKLRPPIHLNISGSQRRELPRVTEDDNQPIIPDPDSVANVRFSAHTFVNSDFSPWLPFALIMPEDKRSRRRQKPMSSPATPIDTSTVVPIATSTGEDKNFQVTENALSKGSLQDPPADMKGVFIRRFRWGTVDSLDPKHCDFAALRTAILSTHVKVGFALMMDQLTGEHDDVSF